MKSKNLDILIVEDSISYAIELEQLCIDVGLNVLETVADSANALDIIFDAHPDLILMDISIDGRLSGLDIAQKIKHLNIPILFITSFGDDKSILQAQQSNMAGYLIKPVSEEDLTHTLNKIIKASLSITEDEGVGVVEKNNDQLALFFLKNSIYQKIKPAEIIYVQSEDNYCRFILSGNEQFLLRITLGNVEKMIIQHGFIRTHRRFIVNVDRIEEIHVSESKLSLAGGIEVAFSRSRKEDILQLGKFLK